MKEPKTILSVGNLSHAYSSGGQTQAVINNISFDVKASQMVTVGGESGSGKTTLLLACGAMQLPTSGVVSIGGQDLYSLSSAQRASFRAIHIGYLFQTLELIPYLNLIDNVRMAHGVTRAESSLWLDKLGLADRKLHKPQTLSHGQRQRAALARALAHRPDLVIADEPTGNLDAGNSQLVFQTLREFANDGGAVLIATHDATNGSFADKAFEISNTKLHPAGKSQIVS